MKIVLTAEFDVVRNSEDYLEFVQDTLIGKGVNWAKDYLGCGEIVDVQGVPDEG